MTPASAPHSFATPAMTGNKEGGEAGLTIDDDDVIDILAEKRYDSLLPLILNTCGTRLLRQLDLRILPAVALTFTLGVLAGNLVRTHRVRRQIIS